MPTLDIQEYPEGFWFTAEAAGVEADLVDEVELCPERFCTTEVASVELDIHNKVELGCTTTDEATTVDKLDGICFERDKLDGICLEILRVITALDTAGIGVYVDVGIATFNVILVVG
jgi:hypothetical protein